MTVYFVLIIILVILSFGFSGSEVALFSIKKYQLAEIKKKNPSFHEKITGMLNRSTSYLMTIVIVNSIVNIAASSLSLRLFYEANIKHYQLYNFLVMSFIVILIGEIFPKTVAMAKNLKFLSVVYYPLYYFRKLFNPLVSITTWFNNFILSLIEKFFKTGREKLNKEELFAFLEKTEGLTGVSREEKLIHQNLIRLLDRDIVTLVKPRREIEGIDLAGTASAIEEILKETSYRYLPVYRKQMDNVIGIFDRYEILKAASNDYKRIIETNLLKGEFVPEQASVSYLLKKLQKEIPVFVVDEYGGLTGLVDVEMIVRTVFMTRYSFIKKLSEKSCLVNPWTTIYEIELYYEEDIFEKENTLSLMEYFLDEYSKLPSKGSYIKREGLRITVEEIEGYRIKKFKVERDVV